MIKLKKLLLKNYYGYKNLKLDFVDREGGVKRWAIANG